MRSPWDGRLGEWVHDFDRRPYRTGWKWFWGILGTALLVGIVFTVVGFANSWWQKGVEIISPVNVEKQFTRVIDNWESLYAAAENACLAKSSMSENSPTFVESPEQAYAATFRKIVVDYNRRQANLFEAGVVGPPGYPSEIPRSLGSDGEWCAVPAALDRLPR